MKCGDLSPLCLPNSAFSGVLQGGPKQRRWRFLLKSIGMTQVDGGATITRKKALTSHRTPKSACFRNELHRFLSRSKYRTCGGVGSTGPCTAPKASATFVRRLSGAYVCAMHWSVSRGHVTCLSTTMDSNRRVKLRLQLSLH